MDRIATTAWLTISGLAFIAFPVLRPWGAEVGLAGADTFGSPLWPISHLIGMIGFVALAFALRSASRTRPADWVGRPIREVESRMWLAVGLLLPFYGAEAYGLHALGEYAAAHRDAGLVDLSESIRNAPLPLTTFGLGLFLLILVGARVAIGMWRSGVLGRTGGVLAGLGLATYLPQFFGGAELRVTHGVLLGAGLLLVAAAWLRQPTVVQPSQPRQGGSGSIDRDRGLEPVGQVD